MAKKKAVKKRASKKKVVEKKKSDSSLDARTLTPKDQENIQRLLKTAELGKVRLAIELTEETCSDADLNDIYTDEIILSMISSGDVELFAVTASFFLRHREHWDRFLQCATNTRVLTGTAMLNRTADLADFTAITSEAAALLAKEESWIDLTGLSTISLEVVQQLVKTTGTLNLSGLTVLTDELAAALSKHKGDRLELNGLASLSDAAAKSLSNHKGGDNEYDGLELNGLTSLSDAAAKCFGNHKSGICLDGITHLSEVAAKHLAKHKNKLSLYGLEEVSHEAALVFASKTSLQTNEAIRKQIANATKTYTAAASVLSPQQQKQIRKLINGKQADHLITACELLRSAGAKEGDWLTIFLDSKLKALLHSWDPEIWNILVAEMKVYPKVFDELCNAIERRINYTGYDYSVYHRFAESLDSVVAESSNDLTALIQKLLTSEVKDCISPSSTAALKAIRK